MTDEVKKSNIPDSIKERSFTSGQMLDPALVRLQMAAKLAENPANDLTELSDDEIITFRLIEALHNADLGLDFTPVLDFYGMLKADCPSLDRKRTDEYLKGLIGQVSGQVQPYAYYGAPGTVSEEKPGFFDKINPWSKKK